MIEKVRTLKLEQLELVVKSRRAVPLAQFLAVNSKARSACVQRHYKWQEELITYSNAIIEACVRSKIGNSLSVATLVSAFESMGLGIIAKGDLELDEYNLIVSPALVVFPELYEKEQTWTVTPLDENSRYRPAIPYQLPPETSRTEATSYKKTRQFRRNEDAEPKEEETFDSVSFMDSLKPKAAKEKPVLTKQEAINAMMAAISKPPVEEENIANVESVIADIEKVTSDNFPEVQALKMLTPEDIGLKPLFIKMIPEGGKFKLKDEATGIYYGGEFDAPLDAIIWAAKNAMKIK